MHCGRRNGGIGWTWTATRGDWKSDWTSRFANFSYSAETRVFAESFLSPYQAEGAFSRAAETDRLSDKKDHVTTFVAELS